ncbi:MAG TPA: S8 family serine peptidase [Nostocaceae cyanobacterium]|nr:S8 family serine peptidase [Nostocaceae cyanobacterium]
MKWFGFGQKKSQKPENQKVWQGQSFILDEMITPSTLVNHDDSSSSLLFTDIANIPTTEEQVTEYLFSSLNGGGLEAVSPTNSNYSFNLQTIIDALKNQNLQNLQLPNAQLTQLSVNTPINSGLSCPVDPSTFNPNPSIPTVPTNPIDYPVIPINPNIPIDPNVTGPILPFDPPSTETLPRFNFPKSDQPLIGVIDTGFNGNNPDIDYSRVKLGRDRIDNDNNPLLADSEGSEHGTHVLGIIAATEGNDIGIDGINNQAPLWLGRAIGSGKWAESLKEFVDEFKASGQPTAVVNLSLDLTQQNPDSSVTTRYEFTPQEREALEYARQNHVLIVAAAGNDGGVMSVLGQASQEFDNIITVGASDGENRADYSNYGEGLDILANGGTIENPILSTAGNSVGTMAGTSVAAAEVTGAASQVWAANPQLSYRQVIDILKATATDINTPGWDRETGAGLLDIDAAVEQAKNTTPEIYNPESFLTPTTWGGEGQVTPTERAVEVWPTWFNGRVMSTIGANIRSGPGTGYSRVGGLGYNARVDFDGWTYGERITDIVLGTPDERWYRIAGTNNWVASAIIDGNAPGSTPLPPPPSQPQPNLNNTVGYDGGATHQTYINTFNRNGGSSVLGSPTNNVHRWENGYTQDFSGGSDSQGAIMKSNANDNSYWVGGDFWNKFLDTGGANGILQYPTSDRYSTNGGQKQDFQGGAILQSGRGIFPVFGGIGSHYLNNEGGQNGRLGFPTSGEIGVGNGVIVQNFENGRIVFGNGPTRTEMNNQPVAPPPTSTTINGYTVSGNFYPVYENYRGTLGNPTSGVINHSNGVSYQLFERGSIVSSQYGTFPIFGGIRQTYLNTGGLNGWLGAPKSAEIGQGNGTVIQYFANGYIIWNGSKATAYRNGSGTPSQPTPTPKPSNNLNLKNFRGWVMPGIGVALRNSPSLNDKSGKAEPYGKWLDFDAWAYGDTVKDYQLGNPDNRWFRIKGTNYWVPSAYIYGNPEGLPGSQTPGGSSNSGGSNGSSGVNNNQPITNYSDYLKRLYGGSPGVITQYPNYRHNAIDSVNQGSVPYKVYALTGGEVKFIGKDQYGGNFVKIWNTELKRYFYYVHFANFNPALKVGQKIAAGTYLGNEGSTGNSTGRHTHVHVTLPDGKTKVDPLSALGVNSGSSGSHELPTNNQNISKNFQDPTEIDLKTSNDPLRGFSKMNKLDFEKVGKPDSTWRPTDSYGFGELSGSLETPIIGSLIKSAAQTLEDTLWHFFEGLNLPRANRHLRHFLVQTQDPGEVIKDISVDDMLKYIHDLKNRYEEGQKRAKKIIEESWKKINNDGKRIKPGSYWIEPQVDAKGDNYGFSPGLDLLSLINIDAWLKGDTNAKNTLDFYCVLGNFQYNTQAKFIVNDQGSPNIELELQMRIRDNFNFDMKTIEFLKSFQDRDIDRAINGLARIIQSAGPETLVKLGMANNYVQWGESSVIKYKGNLKEDGTVEWL